ncbi:MAG: hypothetical protein EBZ67_11640 [Chitinophagia bacterium]|nr:hypothetical protein [Chitinophagia bacterium]
MTVGDIIGCLEDLAPPSLAESYDNVGLLTGDRTRPCQGVLVCLDVTAAVLEEALAKGCDLVGLSRPSRGVPSIRRRGCPMPRETA